jgi:hypothetical protein
MFIKNYNFFFKKTYFFCLQIVIYSTINVVIYLCTKSSNRKSLPQKAQNSENVDNRERVNDILFMCIHNLLKYKTVYYESFEIPKKKHTFVVITNTYAC